MTSYSRLSNESSATPENSEQEEARTVLASLAEDFRSPAQFSPGFGSGHLFA